MNTITKEEILALLGQEHLVSNPKIQAIAEALSKLTLEDLVHPESFILTPPNFYGCIHTFTNEYYRSPYNTKAIEYSANKQRLANEELRRKTKARTDWILENLGEGNWVKTSYRGAERYGMISDCSSKVGYLGLFMGDPLAGKPIRRLRWIPVNAVTHYIDGERMGLTAIPTTP